MIKQIPDTHKKITENIRVRRKKIRELQEDIKVLMKLDNEGRY